MLNIYGFNSNISASLRGIEPRSRPPEGRALSIELQGQFYIKLYQVSNIAPAAINIPKSQYTASDNLIS